MLNVNILIWLLENYIEDIYNEQTLNSCIHPIISLLMANYHVLEGNWRSSLVYRNGTHTYIEDKDSDGIRYLRCAKYKYGCPGRAKLDLNLDVFSMVRGHGNHESFERDIEVMNLKLKLKRKAEYSQGSLREIFDDEVDQSPVAGYISFPQLENTMYKRRRLHTHHVPLNAQNAISLMESCDDEYKKYYAFSIEESLQDEFAIAFMSPKWQSYIHY